MARPLRLEFAGALYHVTSRGDGREAIFLADGDLRAEGIGAPVLCPRVVALRLETAYGTPPGTSDTTGQGPQITEELYSLRGTTRTARAAMASANLVEISLKSARGSRP